MSPFQQDCLSEANPKVTSQRLSRVFQQQSVVLAAVSVFLFICAFLLTVGLVLSGYLLIRAIGFLI